MAAVASDLQPSEAVPVHASGIVPVVQTVAVDVKFGCTVDLDVLARKAPNIEYKGKDTGDTKKRFDCADLRITKPAATGRVYARGSMTVTGTRSPQDARLAVQKLCSVIQSAGFEVDQATVDATFQVNMMMATCKAGFPINLHGIFAEHSAFVKFEPSTWHGLVYYMREPKVTLIIFSTGSFNMTGKGLQSLEDISTVLDNIWPILEANKLKPPSATPAPAATTAVASAAASAAAEAAPAAPVPAAAAAAAGAIAAQMGSSSTSSLQPGLGLNSTTFWQLQQQQRQQQQQQQPYAVAGVQVQLARQVTTGVKRPRPAAEIIKAAAAAGKLPEAQAQRAAVGNRGFRVGEGPPQALPPVQLHPAVPNEQYQQSQLYQQQYQQFQQLVGAPWPTAAGQPDGLGFMQQSQAVGTAVGAAAASYPPALGEQPQQQEQQQAPAAAAPAAFQLHGVDWQQQPQSLAAAAPAAAQLPGAPVQQGLHKPGYLQQVLQESWPHQQGLQEPGQQQQQQQQQQSAQHQQEWGRFQPNQLGLQLQEPVQQPQGQHLAPAVAGGSVQEMQGVHDSSMAPSASAVDGMPPASPVHDMMPEIASPVHYSYNA